MWILRSDGEGETYPWILINVETAYELRLKITAAGGSIVFMGHHYRPGIGEAGFEQVIGRYDNLNDARQIFKMIAKKVGAIDAAFPSREELDL